MQPEDLLYFVYLDEFRDDWRLLAGNDVDEVGLWDLEMAIMSDPSAGPIIKGTGGLRKFRFVRLNSKGKAISGKSSGIRVCYAYFEEYHLVLMVMAYGKNEKDNLSDEECNAIADYLAITEKWLRSTSK